MIFNKDFFPTPELVIDMMCGGLDFTNKVVLEPSAGSGNILDYVSERGAKTIACENSEQLGIIAKEKSDVFLCNDFLDVTREQISHIDYIIMNPPFSSGDKHILHAWNIAPDGCEIYALCNYETINNRYSRLRGELGNIIKDYGIAENIGDVFTEAERETGIDIGFIRLFKPKSESDDWSDYFSMDEDEAEQQENGVMSYNAVREVVQRYVAACKLYDSVADLGVQMNSLIGVFGVKELVFNIKSEEKEKVVDNFKVELRKLCWKWIFSKMNMEKFMTQSLREELNAFTEKQQNVPFTMKNIYKMFEMVIATHGNRMERVYVEVFDKLTKHYHANRYNVEGWKTNSHYMVNQKFILESVFELDWSGGTISAKYAWRGTETMDDLMKALDYMEGTSYHTEMTKYGFYNAFKNIHTNIWLDCGHLEIKGFKKGTLHGRFKDRDVWARFNQIVAKSKGYELPSKY